MQVSNQYVAGFMDGEGCFQLLKNTNQRSICPRVHITLTYKPTLELIYIKYGGGIKQVKKQKPHHKNSWQWTLSAYDELLYFCEDIEPFLIEKYPQCKLMLEYLHWRGEYPTHRGHASKEPIPFETTYWMLSRMKELRNA